eukprot:CAMPEP_0171094412 /NCGR_PEP_ID=MMETSP0766_2-20121228/41054_1 /TAXON_ID=439317 /ORGANISM="Gambierdiscus australes, Strain CAWD 149" /LENGTH=42 /DNA_ID= /DNA_START= /DNA_END= /DNA_ORIENTATION=
MAGAGVGSAGFMMASSFFAISCPAIVPQADPLAQNWPKQLEP